MIRHKHVKLEQAKLDTARKFLGLRTESETIERALDSLVADAKIERALHRLGGKGFAYEDAFGEQAEIARQPARRARRGCLPSRPQGEASRGKRG